VIGLDTNVLVRYFAQDDREQSEAASRLIEALDQENPGLVTTVALAETVWVVEERYAASRAEDAAIIEKILQTRAFVVQDAEQAWQALARYRSGVADFSDYLIERICGAHGAEKTYTFDKKDAHPNECGMTLVA
jgi:predicted nucleic-acid-binding protein